MDNIPTVTFNNALAMPILGFGTYHIHEGDEARRIVGEALEAGYRSVDTAALYGNEKSIGQAVRASGVPRPDIFITTKVWNADQGYESTLRAFEMSLHQLGMDYIDLYLVHWPVTGKYKHTWQALEHLYEQKIVRAIGVSNFGQQHLEDLLRDAMVTPAVNQVELHPLLPQTELRNYCTNRGIAIEAWAPLMQGGELLNHPVLMAVARKHGKTAAQIVLRWHIQQGIIAIPKAAAPGHIRQNINIFDFELSDDDMRTIHMLDTLLKK